MRFHPCIPLIALVAMLAPRAAQARDGRRERTPSAPRLTLTFVDFARLPPETLAGFQQESAELMARLGVQTELRSAPPGATLDADGVTLIVMDGFSPRRMRAGVMGAVQRQGAARVLWIFPGSVADGAGLAWDQRRAWSSRDHAAFLTAMARVAIHEVVHLTCPWREHDRRGLMAAVLDRASLVGSGIPLSSELRRDVALGVAGLSGDSRQMARDARR